uniref:Uncharacterized protein n=1 Tax=Arundo donax TaxID=35708 RepID=A0A0A9BV83_ARUDO
MHLSSSFNNGTVDYSRVVVICHCCYHCLQFKYMSYF